MMREVEEEEAVESVATGLRGCCDGVERLKERSEPVGIAAW